MQGRASVSAVELKVCETEDAFDLPEWRGLAGSDPHRTIFSLPEWNKNWWQEFGEGKKLFVLTFLDPEPIGLVPLVLDRVDRAVRIRFVGGDDLTDYLGPLVASDSYLPSIADLLVKFLLEEVGGWSYFLARCLPVPFGFAEWLVEAADRLGMGFSIDQDELTAILPLPSTFEDYLAQLPRDDRHELRRKLRRFEREAPEFEIVTSTAETLDEDLDVFVHMHRGSEGMKGKFMAPERATFFSRLARTFQPLGMLSFDFLQVAGRRIASTFSFTFERTFYLYNSAYEQEARPLSPGVVLVSKLIERAIEGGFNNFDFLRGRERYKYELGAQPLPLHSVRLTHPAGSRPGDGPG